MVVAVTMAGVPGKATGLGGFCKLDNPPRAKQVVSFAIKLKSWENPIMRHDS
jgi:hypothetical protein